MNNLIGIVVGIFGGLIAYIMYILKVNNELKRTNAETETKAATIESVTKANAQEEKANESQKSYEELRDEYLRTHPNDKRDGS